VGLPGVGITLVGEGRTVTTTSAGTGPGAGTFAVRGLEVPGSYQITFTLADHASVVRTATLSFADGAYVHSVNPTLVPNPGPVTGSVRDELGAPVAGASVTLTDSAATVRTAATDGNGRFAFASVAAGPSVIDVTFAGQGGATGRTSGVAFIVPAGGGALPEPIRIAITQPTITPPTITPPTTNPPTTTQAPTTT